MARAIEETILEVNNIKMPGKTVRNINTLYIEYASEKLYEVSTDSVKPRAVITLKNSQGFDKMTLDNDLGSIVNNVNQENSGAIKFIELKILRLPGDFRNRKTPLKKAFSTDSIVMFFPFEEDTTKSLVLVNERSKQSELQVYLVDNESPVISKNFND